MATDCPTRESLLRGETLLDRRKRDATRRRRRLRAIAFDFPFNYFHKSLAKVLPAAVFFPAPARFNSRGAHRTILRQFETTSRTVRTFLALIVDRYARRNEKTPRRHNSPRRLPLLIWHSTVGAKLSVGGTIPDRVGNRAKAASSCRAVTPLLLQRNIVAPNEDLLWRNEFYKMENCLARAHAREFPFPTSPK